MYFLFFKLHSKDSAAAEGDLFRGSLDIQQIGVDL